MKRIIQTILITFFMLIATSALAININTASKEEIMAELYRVGTVTADRIINERQKGPFKDEMDLQTRVMGLGPRIIEQNRMNIQFTDEAAAQAEQQATPVLDPATGEPMSTGVASPNNQTGTTEQPTQTNNQPTQNNQTGTTPQEAAPQQGTAPQQ